MLISFLYKFFTISSNIKVVQKIQFLSKTIAWGQTVFIFMKVGLFNPIFSTISMIDFSILASWSRPSSSEYWGSTRNTVPFDLLIKIPFACAGTFAIAGDNEMSVNGMKKNWSPRHILYS